MSISEREYLDELDALKVYCDSISSSPMMNVAKINALITLNMRYETLKVNPNLEENPFLTTRQFVRDARTMLEAWSETAFIEASEGNDPHREERSDMEERHHDLFQDLWVNFSEDDYNQRIERYAYRLKINGLADGFLNGMSCIDFGCGHGNFLHAMVRAGASAGLGIDFGEKSVAFAKKAAEQLEESRVEYRVGNVYSLDVEDQSYDFAIQNGVFHHLHDEDKAIAELARVLKPGGYIWYYTDGAGAISRHLWNASVHILREVEHELVVRHLEYLNIGIGKRYHLGDGLKAVYRSTSYEEMTERLSKFGFGDFKRLVGGFPTDFDHDAISTHNFGVEKFGCGDIRILAKRL